MIKYEFFDYDIEEGYTVKDVIPTGIIINTDASKASICENLGLYDQEKIDVYCNADVIYIDYDGRPYCELRKKD